MTRRVADWLCGSPKQSSLDKSSPGVIVALLTG